MIALSEQQILEQIAVRLTGTYPGVPVDAVSRLVHEQHARFEGSRIRDFVPLFVERHARAELNKVSSSTAV
ncbi:three-helix bundle dimerization domain-containing protein [Mycobacterium sp. IS-3022]|uniref:three-helix bundle dimerization domain-containing protein n=1 Tax=Mycobacterium sp. IS-3022 TaxID=1772277 RepID=UPI00074161E6|nr:DUF3562 domain-containing protein [Mycobacterium sp. IS-3022]KUI04855.1 hypothetical protein AU188_09675 [Mycobacterium sp. IS-3022]